MGISQVNHSFSKICSYTFKYVFPPTFSLSLIPLPVLICPFSLKHTTKCWTHNRCRSFSQGKALPGKSLKLEMCCPGPERASRTLSCGWEWPLDGRGPPVKDTDHLISTVADLVIHSCIFLNKIYTHIFFSESPIRFISTHRGSLQYRLTDRPSTD